MLVDHLTVIARAELKKPRMERVCLKLNDTGVLGELNWPNLTGGVLLLSDKLGSFPPKHI